MAPNRQCGTRPKTGSTRKNPSCCGLWENWGERDRLSGRPLCAERRGSLHPLFDTGPQRAGTDRAAGAGARRHSVEPQRSEEHTSELQSLMRNPYAVFCLKKKKKSSTEVSYSKHYSYHQQNVRQNCFDK